MSRAQRSVAVHSFLATLAFGSTALAGPIWEGDAESDAKQAPSDAQVITTDGTVALIKGQLTGSALMGSADYIDMYLVRIVGPSVLKLSTAGGEFGGGANFDSQLFLFRAVQTTQGQFAAQGIFANNDLSSSNKGALLTNSANDGSQFVLQQAGLYFIAITNGGVDARNANGGPIWPGLDQPGLRSFGGFQDFQAWGGDPSADVGDYEIRVEGIAGVPAPGALGLLGLAGLVGRRRR
ncbi:MAG: hypothetical protein NTU45_08725 [Planctomycetota bacterium]|jgi:MYXO-CTERM domain-containing protein|nr:hypothetical protein [Planctomycetota bacterium]